MKIKKELEKAFVTCFKQNFNFDVSLNKIKENVFSIIDNDSKQTLLFLEIYKKDQDINPVIKPYVLGSKNVYILKTLFENLPVFKEHREKSLNLLNEFIQRYPIFKDNNLNVTEDMIFSKVMFRVEHRLFEKEQEQEHLFSFLHPQIMFETHLFDGSKISVDISYRLALTDDSELKIVDIIEFSTHLLKKFNVKNSFISSQIGCNSNQAIYRTENAFRHFVAPIFSKISSYCPEEYQEWYCEKPESILKILDVIEMYNI